MNPPTVHRTPLIYVDYSRLFICVQLADGGQLADKVTRPMDKKHSQLDFVKYRLREIFVLQVAYIYAHRPDAITMFGDQAFSVASPTI